MNCETQIFLPRHVGQFFSIDTLLFDDDAAVIASELPATLTVIGERLMHGSRRRTPMLCRSARALLFFGFAFAVMADPVSSVAYAIEAALRALDGHLATSSRRW